MSSRLWNVQMTFTFTFWVDAIIVCATIPETLFTAPVRSGRSRVGGDYNTLILRHMQHFSPIRTWSMRQACSRPYQ